MLVRLILIVQEKTFILNPLVLVIYIIKQDIQKYIAGQTAGPNGLKLFGDTQSWVAVPLFSFVNDF